MGRGLLLVALWAPSLAWAQEAGITDGEVRWRVGLLTDFPTATVPPGQAWVVEQRLRPALTGSLFGVEGRLEVDVFTGQLLGQTWALGPTDDRARDAFHAHSAVQGFRPRVASLARDTDGVRLMAGLATDHWGLGLRYNDGDHDPVFGSTSLGDRVLRLAGSGSPGRSGVWLAGSVELVVEDDDAWVFAGDQATQGWVAAWWEASEGPDVEGGLRLVGRRQGGLSSVADGWVRAGLTPGPVRVQLAAEGVVTREFEGGRGAGGGVFVADVARPADPRTGAGILVGGASAGFTFDRNFDVGLVLFDEVLGALEVASGDPEPSEGAVEGLDAGLVLAAPIFRLGLLPWLHVRAGGVLAAGGELAAVEADWGVGVQSQRVAWLGLDLLGRIEAQGGHVWGRWGVPAPAVHAGQLVFTGRWGGEGASLEQPLRPGLQ